HNDEIVSWIITVVHEGENGAIEPGGMPSAAEQVYDQGLMVSPMKIGRNYELHRDIVTFFQNSVREPKLMITDLKAKLYAAIRIQKRMEETVSEYGIDALIATLRKTLDDTDKETRRRLKEWPDGTVRAQSMADGTLRENILIKTQLKMTKKDDKLIF